MTLAVTGLACKFPLWLQSDLRIFSTCAYVDRVLPRNWPGATAYRQTVYRVPLMPILRHVHFAANVDLCYDQCMKKWRQRLQVKL